MERTSRGFASSVSHRNWSEQVRRDSRQPRQLDPLNPASRVVNRSLRAAEFARVIERDLNPRGPLEGLVARQVVRSALRLREDLAANENLTLTTSSPEGDRAARALEVAITTLDLLQNRRGAAEGSETPVDLAVGTSPFAWIADDEVRPGFESNEWPVVPRDDAGCPPDDDLVADDDDAPVWRDRLVYDFDVSDQSPVVQGTWITVAHIVSLIVDGATWADILRTHPELVEADIRTCVAYAVAEEDATL